jgi:hypothetical protein
MSLMRESQKLPARGSVVKVDGKDAYEVRGKDERGKVREVEVLAYGEVLGVE